MFHIKKNNYMHYLNYNKNTIKHTSHQVPNATCFGTRVQSPGSFWATKFLRSKNYF